MQKTLAAAFPILAFIIGTPAMASISCITLLLGGGASIHPVVSQTDRDTVTAVSSGHLSTYKLVASSSRGSLYYSSAAEKKAKALDELIGSRDMASEIGGVGLTTMSLLASKKYKTTPTA